MKVCTVKLGHETASTSDDEIELQRSAATRIPAGVDSILGEAKDLH